MARENYIPNERVIDKAVSLWRAALADPIYRAAVPGTRDAGLLALTELHAMSEPSNANDECLDKFAAALKKILMTAREYGELKEADYVEWIGVDYHPDKTLRQAADEAGLDTSFPLKTDMMLGTHYVSFSMGYGTKSDYYYIVDDEKWMLTDIYPAKLGTLLEDVKAGRLPNEVGVYEKYSIITI